MKTLTAALVILMTLSGCRPSEAGKIPETIFQRKDVSGATTFTVTLRRTAKVSAALLKLMEKTLTIRRVEPSSENLEFWREAPMALRADRAEIQVELTPADTGVNVHDFVYDWPDAFQISRPGVLEVAPDYGDVQPQSTPDPGMGDMQPAQVNPNVVRGRIMCMGAPAQQIAVVVANQGTQAQSDGSFEIRGTFNGVPTRVYVAYKANIRVSAISTHTPPLEIMNDFHDTRNESVDQVPVQTGEVADFGNVNLAGNDCILWNFGVRALTDYFQKVQAVPPAGGLRVKRWTEGYATAHTFYDYIVAPTNLATRIGADRTFYHEFGHSIRHVADGGEAHWHWDNFRFIYARNHNGSQVTNKAFVFNEGWAKYWATVVLGGAHPNHPNVAGPEFLDWNEDRIANYLRDMQLAIAPETNPDGPRYMIKVLTSNPEKIHTLYDFERYYCLGAPLNRFCRFAAPERSVPLRAEPASCPPGYTDDGLTCRLNNILAKPSFGRGVGVVPNSCGAGREYDWGLCYPVCRSGFHGVGPVCWQNCPPGYNDDGATCRRDARIFGSNNSACPWYDKCGLTFARGCSVCPPGYSNDGCTCRADVHIFAKSSYGRGVGGVPSGCSGGMQYDAGLCYTPCPAGYSGVGPVCWGSCPAGYDDHGATCYRAPNVFSDD